MIYILLSIVHFQASNCYLLVVRGPVALLPPDNYWKVPNMSFGIKVNESISEKKEKERDKEEKLKSTLIVQRDLSQQANNSLMLENEQLKEEYKSFMEKYKESVARVADYKVQIQQISSEKDSANDVIKLLQRQLEEEQQQTKLLESVLNEERLKYQQEKLKYENEKSLLALGEIAAKLEKQILVVSKDFQYHNNKKLYEFDDYLAHSDRSKLHRFREALDVTLGKDWLACLSCLKDARLAVAHPSITKLFTYDGLIALVRVNSEVAYSKEMCEKIVEFIPYIFDKEILKNAILPNYNKIL